MSSLEVHNLDAGYRGRPVLQALSLSVRPGEILVLLGPNGAGKTTLLRCLGRLLRPSAGSVLLDSADPWQHGPRWAAQRIALAPQSGKADWPLTVEETVTLGRAAHRGWLLPFTSADHACVDLALKRTGLAPLRHRAVTELSAGEGQLVLLARALAQQPRVLLFDEPTAHLDLRHQGEILGLVHRLAHEDRLAVVLALHDLNLAALWADRLALLVAGRLLALGTPEEVLTPAYLEQAYGVAVTVARHPIHGTPLVTPMGSPR